MLKTYTEAELKEILEKHKHWWYEDCEGWENMKADLSYTNLKGADLTGAYLKGADLTGADLTGADLKGAKNIPHVPMACPTEGAFIGWKKACLNVDCPFPNNVIVKLEIPEDAKRSSATTNKCRCDKAKVIEVQTLDGKIIETNAFICSMYDFGFRYKVGDIIKPREPFCEDRWQECASGIHFFIDRGEAERW